MTILTSIFFLSAIVISFVKGGRYDPAKCSKSAFSEKWTSTGEVPGKLSQEPPSPLYMMYNRKTVYPNETITTEEMLRRPYMKWNFEKGSRYTIMIVDFGIKRLGGKQYFHWLVTNVPSYSYKISGDEVRHSPTWSNS